MIWLKLVYLFISSNHNFMSYYITELWFLTIITVDIIVSKNLAVLPSVSPKKPPRSQQAFPVLEQAIARSQ